MKRDRPNIVPEWFGVRELSTYAAVSQRTLRTWIHSPVDPLPAVRIGGKMLVRRSEVDAWLERHTIVPAPSLDLDLIVSDVLQKISHGR